jgi:hypothetical protein
MTRSEAISVQATGAFGEKSVEAELLRRHWIPANVNASIKNAAKFDIYALKATHDGDLEIQLRIKTCRPNMTAFLWGGCQPGKPITTAGIGQSDYTVVVRMGSSREDDQFYVVPTAVVLKEVGARQREQKARGVRDIGMWRMSFKPRKDGRPEAGTDIENKWSGYLNGWDLLDGVSVGTEEGSRR